MQRVTLKAYAVKHNLSIFNVMKMVRSNALNSETIDENGKEVTYILLDEETEKEIEKNIKPLETQKENSLKDEIKLLNDEVKRLREEIEVLKKKL